eukprot:563671-Hanusia_phi.AAC.1
MHSTNAQTACSIGYYSSTGNEPCTRCAHLTTTNSTGKTSINDCIAYKPIVSYQFEDPADLGKDSSGNGYDATLYNSPTEVSGRRANGAIEMLASSTQYAALPSTLDLWKIRADTGITIAFWARMTPNTASYVVTDIVADSIWRYHVITIQSDSTVSNPGQLNLWIDTVFKGSTPCGVHSVSGSVPNLYIGKDKFDGDFDDFRIYDFPFTTFDIEQHYFPLYYPTGCLPIAYNPNPGSYHYPELVASKDFPGVTNLNNAITTAVDSLDTAFRAMVDND